MWIVHSSALLIVGGRSVETLEQAQTDPSIEVLCFSFASNYFCVLQSSVGHMIVVLQPV